MRPLRNLSFRLLIQRLSLAFLLVAFVFSSVFVYTYTRTGAQARVYAATSSNLNFQARLLASAGNTVPDGTYNLEFNLYDAASGGTSLWTETRTGANKVRVVNGYLSVSLGDVSAFPPTINWDQDLWLTMNVGGTGTPTWDGEMTPRLKLTAVPYAFQAKQAEKLVQKQTAFTGTLDFLANLTADRNITLPDQDGVVCIQGSPDCVDVATTGTSAVTASNSGLEVGLDGLRLIGGCADNQMLRWNATAQEWQCATTSASITVSESDGSPSLSSSALEFGPDTNSSDEFIISDEGGGVTRIRIGNAVLTNGNYAATLDTTYVNTSESPTVGDISGSFQAGFTINANSVALGTDTTGDYIQALGTLTGLSVSGNSGEGSTPGLSVLYGAAANTAVQGNTTLVCAAGTGELSGGGNTITLGTGGTCNTITISEAPVFDTSVTTPLLIYAGALTLETTATGGADDLIFKTGGNEAMRLLENGNLFFERGTNDATISIATPSGAPATYTFSGATGTVLTTANFSASLDAGYVNINESPTAGDISGSYQSGFAVNSVQNNSVDLGTDTVGNFVATITAGGGLTGNATGEGSTPTLSIGAGNGITVNADDIAVIYGSSANSAVQGNTTLVCASGTGDLSGGGNTITLGSGGTCSSITIGEAPVFDTSVTTPLLTSIGALTIQSQATAGADDIIFQTAGTEKLRILENGTLVFGTGANSANLYLSANDTLRTDDLFIAGSGLTVLTGNLNVAAGDIQTNSVTRLENDGDLVNIGNLTAAGALTIANAGAGNDITIVSIDQTIINAGSTIELQDNTNVTGSLDVSSALNAGNGNAFQVNADGDITGNITALNGTSTANGGSGVGTSTSLVLNNATNFDVGNYVQVNSANCGGTGINPCYAKITAKATNTLTITPALRWTTGSTVNEYHVPEIGGINTGSTLANRYGRGYFISGVATGNGTTFYNEDGITTSLDTFNLANENVTTLNIGGAATTLNIGSAATTVSILGSLQTAASETITAGGGLVVTNGGANVTGGIDNNNGGLSEVGAVTGVTGITFASGGLNLAGGGITNAGSIAGVSTLSASGLITSVGLTAGSGLIQGTGGLTISGATSIDGALSDPTGNLVLDDQLSLGSATTGLQISTDGVITDLDDTSVTIAQNLSVTSGGITVAGNSSITGSLTGLTGLTVASGGASITGGVTIATGGLNLTNTGITNAGSVAGVSTISLSGAITGATATNTINGLIINAGSLSGITGYSQATGAFALSGGGNFSIDSAAFDVTAAGAVSGITTLGLSGAITGSTATNTINGLVINSGALSSITGYTQSNGTFALSGGGTFSLDSSAFDVSAAGALSGITTIGLSGAISGATATNTINGLVINSGSLSAITGYVQSSGNFAISGAGTFGTGTGAVSLNGNTTVSGANTFNVGTGLANLGGALTVAGLTTANGGLTLQTGDTLTVNAEGFTDLTGNGLILSGTALTIDATTAGTVAGTTSNSGLIVAADGVSLLRGCANNQILKWATAGGGAWSCAADATGVSDVRAKENIQTIDGNMLDKIANIRIVEFDYNCESPAFVNQHCDTDHQTGVIAQELAQIFPELVAQDERGFFSVRYDALAIYNLKAVGELARTVKSSGEVTATKLDVSGNVNVDGVLEVGTLRVQNIEGLDYLGRIDDLENQLNGTEARLAAVENNQNLNLDLSNITFGAVAATGDTSLQKLTVNLDLIAKGAMIVEGNATFKQAVRFEKDVLLDGQINILGYANVQGLTVNLDLIVRGSMVIDGNATFKEAVRFEKDVVFEKDVAVKGQTTFNSDTAGLVTVKVGESTARVTFKDKKKAKPIISLTLGEGKFAQYSYRNVTEEGFEVILPNAASEDLTFSWVALLAEEVATTEAP